MPRTLATARLPIGAWWNPGGDTFSILAAYQAKGAVDLASSYVNLANPGTRDAAPGLAPTWNVTDGWIFNGVDQYLTTGITATSNLSVLMRFTNYASGYPFGVTNSGTQNFDIVPNNALSVNYSKGNTASRSPNLSSGVLGIAGAQPYRNGAADGAASLSGTVTSRIIVIGARMGATPVNFGSVRIQAWVAYDGSITAAQMATVAAAMAAL